MSAALPPQPEVIGNIEPSSGCRRRPSSDGGDGMRENGQRQQLGLNVPLANAVSANDLVREERVVGHELVNCFSAGKHCHGPHGRIGERTDHQQQASLLEVAEPGRVRREVLLRERCGAIRQFVEQDVLHEVVPLHPANWCRRLPGCAGRLHGNYPHRRPGRHPSAAALCPSTLTRNSATGFPLVVNSSERACRS